MRLSLESKIRRGRAYIRLIEAIDVLLDTETRGRDRKLLLFCRRLAVHRLERMLSGLEAAALADILSASERVWTPVNATYLN